MCVRFARERSERTKRLAQENCASVYLFIVFYFDDNEKFMCARFARERSERTKRLAQENGAASGEKQAMATNEVKSPK